MKRLIKLQTNRQKTNTDQLKILHVMCKMVITNLVFATAMFFRLDLKDSPFYTNNDVSLLSFTCSQLMSLTHHTQKPHVKQFFPGRPWRILSQQRDHGAS